MPEYPLGQAESLPVPEQRILQDQITGERSKVFDKLRNKWTTGVALVMAAFAVKASVFDAEPAYAANDRQAVIGMPFEGGWAYNMPTNAICGNNSGQTSHPSCHEAHSFQWATDLYAGANTEVKVQGNSSQGTVTFQRAGTSDTCSSEGAGIGGFGVIFNVLVDGQRVGQVKYDHLDLVDVGSNPITSGTTIGEITTEALSPTCFSFPHAHMQFKNTEGGNSCYINYSNSAQSAGFPLEPGDMLGVLGSSNSGAPQACNEIPSASPSRATDGDFDGDGTTDYTVFRPSNGTWHIEGGGVVPWGLSGDIPAPGDYNGDGKIDPTVFRPSNQTWYTHSPGVYSAVNQWGLPGDIPVPGDYTGDKITDRAVYRPSNSTWHILGGPVVQWGLSGDIPVPADYDGNGTTDIAVFRPSNGTRYIKNIGVTPWGLPGDIPVPGDYDGNGNTDLGVFRPSNSTWYAHRPGVYSAVTPWGAPGDVPVPGKYGGNSYTDYAVFRPSDQMWHVTGSVYEAKQWGLPGDIPANKTLNAMLLQQYGLIQNY